MVRWIELKMRIEEDGVGVSTMNIEILNHHGDIDEGFLEMLWDDWDIEITDEQWQKYIEKKREVV